MSLTLFRLLSRLLEIVSILMYPIIYLILRANKYLAALNTSATNSERGILIHAASVGEVNAVKPLLIALREKHPLLKIVVTTTTLSGLKVAKNLNLSAHLAVFDLPWLRKKQLQNINPKLIIVVETEIWFNLLDQAYLQGRDVIFVNARLSEKSLRTYVKFKFLLKYLQGPVKCIFSQTEADADRFKCLFDVPVVNAGNLKYATQYNEYDEVAVRQKYGYKKEDFIICLGSSRPGEEALIASILPALKKQIPNLKVTIAIRHPKRTTEVQALFPEAGLLSRLSSGVKNESDVLLVDTIGHLQDFYAICDLAIVGGSFFDFGGHNPLEPAFYGKPLLMGPYYRSCAGSVADLKEHAGIMISNAENLSKDIIELYQNPVRRAALGTNARICMQEGSLSLNNHLRGLQAWL